MSTALEVGFRLIDTAPAYGNEAAVGRAIAASGIPRAEIFVTTKLATEDQGFQAAQDACQASLERLGTGLRRPLPDPLAGRGPRQVRRQLGRPDEAREDGCAKSIGVCNFTAEDLSNVIDLSYFTPAVNQIELHPLLNQAALRAVNAEHGIVTEAYGPLGVGRLLDNPTVTSVAGEYGKTPAQVLIRWSMQLGNVVIPRSSTPERIAENFDVFDFELTDDAHGRAQRARRRHPVPARPGDLHRHLAQRLGRDGRHVGVRPRRAAPPPTGASTGSA